MYTWRVRVPPAEAWSAAQELTVTDAAIRWKASETPSAEHTRVVTRPGLTVGASGDAALVYAALPTSDAGRTSSEYRAAVRVSGAWGAFTPLAVTGSAAGGTIAIASGQPDGFTVLLVSPAHILSVDYTPVDGWRIPQQVDNDVRTNVRSSPAIAMDGAGNAYAAWIDTRHRGTDVFFAYRPLGGGWGSNEKINDDSNGALQWSPALAVDTHDKAYAIWTDERNGAPSIYAADRQAGGAWGTNVRLSEEGTENSSPAMAADGSDNLYAAWVRRRSAADQDEIVFARRPVGGDWEPAVVISTGKRGVCAPRLVVDKAGHAYAAWDEETASGFALMSAYRPTSGRWGPPVRVNDGAGNKTPSESTLAIDAAGTVRVAWVDSPAAHRSCGWPWE